MVPFIVLGLDVDLDVVPGAIVAVVVGTDAVFLIGFNVVRGNAVGREGSAAARGRPPDFDTVDLRFGAPSFDLLTGTGATVAT